MSRPLRLGVVGFGWFAELLADRVLSALPALDVVAICDRDKGRRARGTHRLGATAFETIDDLLKGSDCEAVAILTPHDTHRALVEAASAAGRHVFCEKAMAVTVDDCSAMIDAARMAGVELMVGHMQKLFPAYARVIELVRGGAYGRPLALAVEGLHWSPVFDGWWRSRQSCGGLLYWTGVHDIDTLRHVVGADVERVYAVTGPKVDHITDYEDSIVVTLEFAGGAVASLTVAASDPLLGFEHSFSLSVTCERGAVRFDAERDVVEHAARAGQERGEPVIESFASYEEAMYYAYRAEFSHFADVVRHGVTSRLPAEDGLRCVAVLQAAYTSVETRAPVELAGAVRT